MEIIRFFLLPASSLGGMPGEKKSTRGASVFEVPTRARSEEVSNWLQMKGVKAPSISKLLLLVKLVKKGDFFFFF